MGKEEIAFTWSGDTYVTLEYQLNTSEDIFFVKRRIDPNKITPSTRKRLWAYVLVNEWATQESTDWFESGYGYDYIETTYFTPLDKGQEGSFETKRWLLSLLMDRETEQEYRALHDKYYLRECKMCHTSFYSDSEELCGDCIEDLIQDQKEHEQEMYDWWRSTRF